MMLFLLLVLLIRGAYGQLECNQVAKITASDGDPFSYFGQSVSVSLSYAVVGAGDAVYVFQRGEEEGDWEQVSKLVGAAQPLDHFGWDVKSAANAEIIVVGAPGENVGGMAGAVYVFKKGQDGLWTLMQRVVSPMGMAAGDFGSSIALYPLTENEYLIGVGASGEGRVHLCIVDVAEETVSFKDSIDSPHNSTNSRFGESISIHNSILIIGAPGSNSAFGYRVVYDQTTKDVQTSLLQSLSPEGQSTLDILDYGSHVLADDEMVLIGAFKEASAGKDSGATYFLSTDGTTFSQQLRIVPHDIEKFDHYGESIEVATLSGRKYILIGAHKKETPKGIEAGLVYVYNMESGIQSLNQSLILTAIDATPYAWYGVTLSVVLLDGNSFLVLVGAKQESGQGEKAGASYIVHCQDIIHVDTNPQESSPSCPPSRSNDTPTIVVVISVLSGISLLAVVAAVSFLLLRKKSSRSHSELKT